MSEPNAPCIPLSLPANWDPDAHMPARETEYGRFHESRAAARLAYQLVENGAPEDLALAERVLEATLACQERRPGANHHGNFYWMAEDEVVEDLNAVEFCLHSLIPMMIRFDDRLSPEMADRVREAIRLGLEEIRRLDVLVAYTNICVLDVLNSSLGGEYLGDAAIAERGYRKLVDWMALTDRAGHPQEYNSPTYTMVTIRALAGLAAMVRDENTRIRARTMAARMGLSAGLHMHRGTGRWAGPHSRAYQPTVVCDTPPEAETYRQWLADGTLPNWLEGVLERAPLPMTVEETAGAFQDFVLSTYHAPSFALGVTSKATGGQANACIVHYARPGAERPGVLYTRYLLNDKWLGDTYHATDRTKSRNLIDEGEFIGAQNGPRAICLYAPGRLSGCSSAKGTLIWTRRDLVDEIWVGDRRVETLPVEVGPEDVVVVTSGSAHIAVRPLAVTDLHMGAPRRLVERQGDLVLELYNYQGPEKRFWELGWPGAFYQGRPQCGFYLEVAERDAYPDGRALGRAVAAGALTEHTDPPFTYPAEGQRLWQVAYDRDGQSVSLAVDLMTWQAVERRRDGQSIGLPMLESPLAVQGCGGALERGGATLRCGQEAAWLVADPQARRWVAGYHGQQPAPLTLEVPGGSVTIEAMGAGTVVWDDGRVTVEAVDLAGTPVVTNGALA